MRESLLQGLWERQSLPFVGLELTSGEELQIWDPGKLNNNAGPDFLNARILIGGTLWAGHVEIHLKSSHWIIHGHKDDPNYRNVILHVVWEDDKQILDYQGVPLATVQLKDYITDSSLTSTLRYQSNARNYLINCQRDHNNVPAGIKSNWWLYLFKERLLHKSNEINTWLRLSQNNWEQVLFISLLRSFGLHVNGDAFLSLGLKLNFSVVQKLRFSGLQLEALFLGMSGLLQSVKTSDSYTSKLQDYFDYLKMKFSLDSSGILRPDFCRLRPSNFPTIRLSQLAVLLNTRPRLFGKLMHFHKRKELHQILSVSASGYWDTHYTLGKESKRKAKRLSPAFMDLLIINSVVPLQFVYARARGRDVMDQLRNLMEACPPEQNLILNNLSGIGMQPNNALHSQALLQNYEHHCMKSRCLECAIGRYLLKGI